MAHGGLRGIMVGALSFPGWDSFAALVTHLRFVRDHHRFVGKIAAVSNSPLLSIAPQLARHFVKQRFATSTRTNGQRPWSGFASSRLNAPREAPRHGFLLWGDLSNLTVSPSKWAL